MRPCPFSSFFMGPARSSPLPTTTAPPPLPLSLWRAHPSRVGWVLVPHRIASRCVRRAVPCGAVTCRLLVLLVLRSTVLFLRNKSPLRFSCSIRQVEQATAHLGETPAATTFLADLGKEAAYSKRCRKTPSGGTETLKTSLREALKHAKL